MKRVEDGATATTPQTFGEAVRAARTELGLSQRALAAKMTELGVPMDGTAVTRVENNQREPRFSEGIALSRFLSFDPFLYAPNGFSYAGLAARTVASYERAVDALFTLLGDTCTTLGMHQMLAEDPLPRDQVADDLLLDIRQSTERPNGTLSIDGDDPDELLAGAYNTWEIEGARMILRHLFSRLGVTDDTPS